ncbi:ArsR/SmtB family transcription factor [Vagococcus xieshaowenii]|uniref:Transcriptional regulator n=1 Tax=Vagococcus xieshaowenii TaxID=2562451 RepID=A0AAJ5EDZ5_9ENTE|nr:metalloregulator ArsR/SmtB family transcription factor [Vagococcus xieshaowenii]QCA29153.1 transcriptional regulator [Vagococcus xieshaowenii]TFZ40870.1 transcriptional regulator [Vagococcus xieshaowenii]
MFNESTAHSLEEWIPKVSQLYKLLGDTTRLTILTLLLESELNVSEICSQLKMEQSAVSHQLRVLRRHHIVSNRREGKTIYYSLDDQHVRDILVKTFTHVAHLPED